MEKVKKKNTWMINIWYDPFNNTMEWWHWVWSHAIIPFHYHSTSSFSRQTSHIVSGTHSFYNRGTNVMSEKNTYITKVTFLKLFKEELNLDTGRGQAEDRNKEQETQHVKWWQTGQRGQTGSRNSHWGACRRCRDERRVAAPMGRTLEERACPASRWG